MKIVPTSPSGCVTLLIERVGLASSLVIVPVPVPLVIMALLALLRVTVKVSSSSKVVSPQTCTVIVLIVSVGAKEIGRASCRGTGLELAAPVQLGGVYTAAKAVPLSVAKSTVADGDVDQV